MEHGAAEWDSLPAGVLEHIVRLHSLVQSLPDAKTRLRSVCRGWHASLPLGECRAGSRRSLKRWEGACVPLRMAGGSLFRPAPLSAGAAAAGAPLAAVPHFHHSWLAGHAVPAHIWRWEEQMAAALAPQARAITVLAPLPHAAASPLPQLARFPRLGRLTLRHIHVAALPALSGLTGLRQLDAIGMSFVALVCIH